MTDQLTTSAEALRLFFTDDVYLIRGAESPAEANSEPLTEVSAESFPENNSAKPIDFKYLGKNQKNVLILVNDTEHEVSTESGRELLRNLVKAMQLNANDFALLNYSRYKQSKFEELNNFFNCKLVLAFGLHPEQLGLNDQEQHMLAVHKNIQLVFSGRLDMLAEDQEGKKKLWGSLKQIIL